MHMPHTYKTNPGGYNWRRGGLGHGGGSWGGIWGYGAILGCCGMHNANHKNIYSF